MEVPSTFAIRFSAIPVEEEISPTDTSFIHELMYDCLMLSSLLSIRLFCATRSSLIPGKGVSPGGAFRSAFTLKEGCTDDIETFTDVSDGDAKENPYRDPSSAQISRDPMPVVKRLTPLSSLTSVVSG